MIRTSSSAGCLFSGRTMSFNDLRESSHRSKKQPDKPDVMEAEVPERKSDRQTAIAKLKEDAKRQLFR